MAPPQMPQTSQVGYECVCLLRSKGDMYINWLHTGGRRNRKGLGLILMSLNDAVLKEIEGNKTPWYIPLPIHTLKSVSIIPQRNPKTLEGPGAQYQSQSGPTEVLGCITQKWNALFKWSNLVFYVLVLRLNWAFNSGQTVKEAMQKWPERTTRPCSPFLNV